MKFRNAFLIFVLCSSFSIFPLAIFTEKITVGKHKITKRDLKERNRNQDCSFLQPKGEFLVCRESNYNPKASFYFQQSTSFSGNYWEKIKKLELLSRNESTGEMTLKLFLDSVDQKEIIHSTKKFPSILFPSFKKNYPIIPEDYCIFKLNFLSANLSCTVGEQDARESNSAQLIFSRFQI